MKPERLVLLLGMLLFLLPAMAVAESAVREEGEVVRDVWNLTRASGDESGWWHERTVRLPQGGSVAYRTESESLDRSLTFGEVSTTTSTDVEEEDSSGRIVAMHSRSLDSDEETIYDLKVKGETAELTITTMGTSSRSSIPWDPETIGPMGVVMLLRKNLEPGRKLSFKVFEFELGETMTLEMEIRGREETELLDGGKAVLWHAVSSIDLAPGVDFHDWIDDKGEIPRSSFDLYGTLIESFITTEKRARSVTERELTADTFMENLVKANIDLPSPSRLDSVLYRFEAKKADAGLPDTIADDIRQEVIENNGTAAVVRITTRVPESSQERPMKNPPADLVEYLESNAFIQSDHADLKAKAMEIVGDETDAWAAACLLEHFVSRYITNSNFSTDFATAAEVFEKRSGDCTESGVLLTAFCRAAGIPARVASGHTYVAGSFGGHMWTEVWINGKWYGLDGTLGNGKVDPGHIRFSTSSLKRGRFAGSLMADTLGLANLEITVLEFVRDGKTIRVTDEFEEYTIKGNTYTNIIHEFSITKPDGFVFMPVGDDGSSDPEEEDDFILLFINGKTSSFLSATPVDAEASMEEFEEGLTEGGGEILSSLPRRVGGCKGTVYMVDFNEFHVRMVAAVRNETLYMFATVILNEERDVEAFERMANTLVFSLQ